MFDDIIKKNKKEEKVKTVIIEVEVIDYMTGKKTTKKIEVPVAIPVISKK